MEKPLNLALLLIDMPVFITTSILSLLFAALFPLQAQIRQQNISNENILIAEKRLSELGYWTGYIDGEFDEASKNALIAFQRKEGLASTGMLSSKDIKALKNARQISPKFAGGLHIEVDKSSQILFFVDNEGKVSHIIPVSTGTGKIFTQGGWTRRAVTPNGKFNVYRKISDWRKSPLGHMYYPSYILGGIAIHGGYTVPNRPSTYGCVKIPLVYAIELSDLMPLDTVVYIYN